MAGSDRLKELLEWQDIALDASFYTAGREEIALQLMELIKKPTIRAYREKKRKLAESKITSLIAKVKYYQSLQIASIAFAVFSVLGTIVISLGISLNMNWEIIVIGIALVLGGEIMPRVLHKKGDDN